VYKIGDQNFEDKYADLLENDRYTYYKLEVTITNTLNFSGFKSFVESCKEKEKIEFDKIYFRDQLSTSFELLNNTYNFLTDLELDTSKIYFSEYIYISVASPDEPFVDYTMIVDQYSLNWRYFKRIGCLKQGFDKGSETFQSNIDDFCEALASNTEIKKLIVSPETIEEHILAKDSTISQIVKKSVEELEIRALVSHDYSSPVPDFTLKTLQAALPNLKKLNFNQFSVPKVST
jgi:hypothetical protein